jgi:tRNA threonylcarbamoyladenosine biosynthesis protein TsaE
VSPVLEPGSLDFISHSEAQTIRLGSRLGTLVQPGQILALIGDLGTGKTRLAQGFGQGMQVSSDEIINSPTFTFINHYQGRLPLYHIDLYRLWDEAEADTLGLEDFFYGDGVCLVEWADRVRSRLPVERLEIELFYLQDTKRRIVVRALGVEYLQLLAAFKKLAFKH